MPIKVLPPLRFLNPHLPLTGLPLQSMRLGSASPPRAAAHIFHRVFPFKLKYLGFAPPRVNSQPGARRFSTRTFRPIQIGSSSDFGRERRGIVGEVRASKSLIEDEAELSDWVSDLRTGSLRGGRVTSDEDDEFGSGRGRGKSSSDKDIGRGREREVLSSNKRRRESDFTQRSNSRDSRVTKRFDGEEERFDSRRKSRGGVEFAERKRGRRERDFRGRGEERKVSGRRGFLDDDDKNFESRREICGRMELGNGKRGRRERDFGRNRDGKRENGNRGFLDDSDDDEEDEDEDERLAGLGDLLREGESDSAEEEEEDGIGDDNDDSVLTKNGRSSPGLEMNFGGRGLTGSPGKSGSYLSETRFDQCAISPLSLKGVRDAGYEKMTIVQEATLPVILKGKDVLAKAKTGTGKTVAFLLPSIEVVVNCPPVGRDKKRPPIHVLVICPTRELASQAAAEANTLLKYHTSIGVQVVIGGTRLALEQKRMQANPCQILVATPGRLRDHIENTAGFATRLMGVKVLVLDEADHLLDMGFRKDIEKIIAAAPKQRQTLLFSATVPGEVRQICHLALKRDHEYINTVEEGTEETHSQVSQMNLVAPLGKQFPLLYTLLKDHVADNPDYKVLVFCTTAMVTRLVADLLGELHLNVREIHSRKPQSYRTRVSDEFRKSKGLILVTSDVSARGVDYPDVTLVVQVGLPADREQYIHRLGRTGRRGKEGQGVLLLAPWEEFFISTIKDLPITKASLPSIDPDTTKKVERALSHVEMKNKEAAYQAWLGYYNSNRVVGKDKYRLVELANEFSRSIGLDNPPAIPKLVLGKMGLRNIPGLRSK